MNQSISRDSVGQSADLRTRIAAVQRAHNAHSSAAAGDWDLDDLRCRCGERVGDDGGMAYHLADAVIRELNISIIEGPYTVSFAGSYFKESK